VNGSISNTSIDFELCSLHLSVFGIYVCDTAIGVLLTQYCAGGKIKKNEMGWACGAYGGGERCAQGFGGEA
jgi:hypothetical protein